MRAWLRRILQPQWELGTYVYDEFGHWELCVTPEDPYDFIPTRFAGRIWISSSNPSHWMPERQMDTYFHRFATGWSPPPKTS